LNSLPDKEYETFILILINGQILNQSNVSAALVNYDVSNKDKQSSSNSTSAETLIVRGRGSNRKDKGELLTLKKDKILIGPNNV